MKTVTIIVPCFNEAEVIPLFFKEMLRIISMCKEHSFTLLFIDDGSNDETLDILRAMSQRSKLVKYISFSRNFGKEAAMFAGMRYAQTDYIGIIDADLQHSPDLIPDMLNALDNEGYDVAAAKRYNREGESKVRSFLSANFYNIVNKVSNVKINNNAFDYRIMKKQVVDAVLELPEHIRFSKGIFSWVGFKVKWFEHGNIARAAGNTKWSLRALSRYALDGILGFTTAPLRIPLWMGAFITAVSLLIFLYTIIAMCFMESFDSLYPLLLSALFFIGGLILASIGLVGEYLARSYIEIQNRPIYIVSETNMKNANSTKYSDNSNNITDEINKE